MTDAINALKNTDPDFDSLKIRAAYRDLSCKGSGPECYRRVRYPGSTEEVWPDCNRLPAQGGMSASERRATVYCTVPSGTIIVDYERQVYKGKRGRCSVTIGVVYPDPKDPAKGRIEWCEHRTLRKRPVYEVTLPNGETIEIERR